MAYPPKLGSKKISIQELNTSGTYLQAVKNIANKTINEISYKSFKEYWEEWQKLVVNLEKVSEDQINIFAEVKATRDLYVHNNGKVNDQYLRKAGKKARSKDLHGKIPIDLDYINSASELAKAFISAIEDEITKKYSHCTKESVFREMWNTTRCGKLLNFDIQWELSKKPYHKKKF